MKGVIFTELIEMVEQKFSLETLDQVIAKANLGHDATYTAVGTYPAGEAVSLVVALSEVTKIPPPDLLFAFGEHLFAGFATKYPKFFEGIDNPFQFLSRVDSYIHIEVRKLYPDAELPKFETEKLSDREIVLLYRSPRRLGDLARGLISGCGKHYGVPLGVTTEDVAGQGEVLRFTVRAA